MLDDKFDYLLRLGDTALVLSQRLSEWVGKGPALEEDMALANTALDLIGQARMWLAYAAEVSFKTISVIPVILFFIFGAVWFFERGKVTK